jgi:uncharacterized membrane protein YvbJ
MKKIFPLFFMFAFLLTSGMNAFSQLRKIPSEVTERLTEKYPRASDIEWRDKLTGFTASFNQDSINYLASFNNAGDWESTEQEIEEEDIPSVIKDSYSKSKYADWEIIKTHKIDLPGNEVRYRVEVGQGDIKKRNLYFNPKGRLLRDKLTL